MFAHFMYHFYMQYGIIMNGCTVWYRLDVAVHNYSYLIIKINNYNELPTFLLKGKTKGTPLWGTHCLKVLKRYHLRL